LQRSGDAGVLQWGASLFKFNIPNVNNSTAPRQQINSNKAKKSVPAQTPSQTTQPQAPTEVNTEKGKKTIALNFDNGHVQYVNRREQVQKRIDEIKSVPQFARILKEIGFELKSYNGNITEVGPMKGGSFEKDSGFFQEKSLGAYRGDINYSGNEKKFEAAMHAIIEKRDSSATPANQKKILVNLQRRLSGIFYLDQALDNVGANLHKVWLNNATKPQSEVKMQNEALLKDNQDRLNGYVKNLNKAIAEELALSKNSTVASSKN
jgi:hypothetical protein